MVPTVAIIVGDVIGVKPVDSVAACDKKNLSASERALTKLSNLCPQSTWTHKKAPFQPRSRQRLCIVCTYLAAKLSLGFTFHFNTKLGHKSSEKQVPLRTVHNTGAHIVQQCT